MPISLFLVISLIHTGAHWFLDMLITSSWDLLLKFWDPHTAAGTLNATADNAISTHTLPESVYHLNLINNTLVVGMVSHLLHVYDIRKMREPVQTRESSLKFMTQSLACMMDEKGTFFSHSSLYHFQVSGATDPLGIKAMWSARSKAGSVWNTLTQVQRFKTRNMHSSATDRCLMMWTTCGRLMCLLSILCTSPTFSAMPYPCPSHLHVCLFASTHQIQHLCISRLRWHCLNLGPQSQKVTSPISKIHWSNSLHCIQLQQDKTCSGCQLYLGQRGGGHKECREASSVGARTGDEVKVSECAVGWVMHGTEIQCFKALTGLERW